MKFRNNRAQERRIGKVDRTRDFLNEFGANFAIFVAHRQAVEHRNGGIGNVEMFGHATPRQFDRIAQLV